MQEQAWNAAIARERTAREVLAAAIHAAQWGATGRGVRDPLLRDGRKHGVELRPRPGETRAARHRPRSRRDNGLHPDRSPDARGGLASSSAPSNAARTRRRSPERAHARASNVPRRYGEWGSVWEVSCPTAPDRRAAWSKSTAAMHLRPAGAPVAAGMTKAAAGSTPRRWGTGGLLSLGSNDWRSKPLPFTPGGGLLH